MLGAEGENAATVPLIHLLYMYFHVSVTLETEREKNLLNFLIVLANFSQKIDKFGDFILRCFIF